jgi:hypothetical protein
MKMPLIGVCGTKNHGKDTFARLMSQTHTRLAFADALKASAAAAFGIPVEDFHSTERKEQPVPGFPDWTHRKVLEHMGTEWFRSTFPGIWTRNVCNQIGLHYADPEKATGVIVTDLRFMDEAANLARAARLANVSFYVIEIKDPRKSEVPDVVVCQQLGLHPSTWNYKLIPDRNLVLNDGTVTDLSEKILNSAPTWKPYVSYV